MDSVRSSLLAAEKRAFFSGSAKEALSFSGMNSSLTGSGGSWLLILGLKFGWSVIGKPESGEICLRASRCAIVVDRRKYLHFEMQSVAGLSR